MTPRGVCHRLLANVVAGLAAKERLLLVPLRSAWNEMLQTSVCWRERERAGVQFHWFSGGVGERMFGGGGERVVP